MTKREQRSTILEARASLSDADRAFFDRLIFEQAHKLRVFQLAATIHVYRNRMHEVETMPFLEYAWSTGKDVYVPVVPPGSSTMISVRVTYATQWTEGSYGIPVPAEYSHEDIADASHFDASTCILVPMVGFDRQCNRLGYGKGFYDRFLQSIPLAPTIGLAYECQRCDTVPTEAHDVQLSAVVTEQIIEIASR